MPVCRGRERFLRDRGNEFNLILLPEHRQLSFAYEKNRLHGTFLTGISDTIDILGGIEIKP